MEKHDKTKQNDTYARWAVVLFLSPIPTAAAGVGFALWSSGGQLGLAQWTVLLLASYFLTIAMTIQNFVESIVLGVIVGCLILVLGGGLDRVAVNSTAQWVVPVKVVVHSLGACLATAWVVTRFSRRIIPGRD